MTTEPMTPDSPENSAEVGIDVQRLVMRVKILEKQLEAAKSHHCFCPDCRDKVRDEHCLRCQVQTLTRKLRKYEHNAEFSQPRDEA